MAYITAEELAKIGATRGIQKFQLGIKEASSPEYADVFLSHSSEDQGEVLDGARLILESHGATVWTDKTSTILPQTTSAITASTIKKQISQCPRFVVLVSENTIKSTWVPWELGVADGKKHEAAVALFPFRRSSTDWPRQEYLGLYRYIEWAKFDNSTKFEWLVCMPTGNTAERLKAWLGK